MSERIKIGLNLGDGLHTSDKKLGVHYVENGRMNIVESDNPGENGLFVGDLNGKDGTGGGSQYDGYTMKAGTGWSISNASQTISNFIDMDRNVVNLIFTFGLYKPTTRHPTTITYSS